MQQQSFAVLLTTDQNLRYQQNLQQADICIVVLVAASIGYKPGHGFAYIDCKLFATLLSSHTISANSATKSL